MDKLDTLGIDWLCDCILNEMTTRQICDAVGVGIGTLYRWEAANEERSARVREARRKCQRNFEEQAVQVLLDAKTPFELAKAREIAHHLRWRASRVAPDDYGDKTTTQHTGVVGTATVTLTDVERAVITRGLDASY